MTGVDSSDAPGARGAEDQASHANWLRRHLSAAVRDHRARSGRSLAELAAQAGIGKSTLHAIERGEVNAGVETVDALARALGVPLLALLPSATELVRVVRGSSPRDDARTSGDGLTPLAVLDVDGPLSMVLLTGSQILPGVVGPTGALGHVLCSAGRWRVGPTGHEVELDEGDLASFPIDRVHRFEPLGGPARAVLLVQRGS